MSQPFCLLGLGPQIERSLEPLLAALPQGPAEPERHISTSDNAERWFEAVLEHQPQILLLQDQGGPNRAALLEDFFKRLGSLNPKAQPKVFLLLEDIKGFLAARIEAGQRFSFKGAPPFGLSHIDQLCLGEEAPEDYQPIEPRPTFSLSAEGAKRPVGNLALEAFEGFNWKGRTFEPDEFFELQAYLKEETSELPCSNSFFLFGGDLFIKRRFSLRELEWLETDGVPIEHLMSSQAETDENAEVFGLKLFDAIRELGHFHWALSRWADNDWLKTHIPLNFKVDHKVLAIFAGYYLQQAGFGISPRPGSLELDLSQGGSDIDWPAELWAIPFFEDLKDQELELDLPPETSLTLNDLARSREALFRRKERLTERQKAFEGAKLLKAQEEDIKVMARRKLELLGQLMERAELYEPDSDEMILKLGQDCLVFYEDESLARQISRHLQGSGKNLFFDIGGFTNLKSLLTYKTDHLVPFLSHGHVLVTAKSREYLIKKLERIGEETQRQTGIKTDLTDQELAQEKDQLQMAFENLACLEAWFRTQPVFEPWLESVGQRLAQTAQDRVRLDFNRSERELVLVARDGAQFSRISGLFKPSKVGGFVARPELQDRLEGQVEDDQETQEALARENGVRVSRFWVQVVEELKPLEADLILIDQEVRVALGLLKQIRQTEDLAECPVVLLLDHELEREELDQLLDLKTLPLYLGRHFSALGSFWSRFF